MDGPRPANSMQLAYHEFDSTVGPQVNYAQQSGAKYLATTVDNGKFSNGGVRGLAEKGDNDAATQPLARPKPITRRKKWIWIAGLFILCIVIAVAAGVGGALGTRKAHTVAPEAGSYTPPQNNTSPPPPPPPPPVVHDDFAYNGTSLASVTYSTTGQPTEQNYVLFYQHSDFSIRKLIYNESTWHPSTFVTNDARPGSGLSAVWMTDRSSVIKIYLYYIDKYNILQELRGTHGSETWVNGTLGLYNFQAATTYSHIDALYVGGCPTGISGWVYYQPADGPVQQAVWNEGSDSWSNGVIWPNTRPASDFVSFIEPDSWRLYTINTSFQLQENVCIKCCSDSNATWHQGLAETALTTNTNLGGAAVGPNRLLFYQSVNNALQELNNTGLSGSESLSVTSGSVAQAMPQTRITMAAGFVGSLQQIHLFYQVNGSDVSVSTRFASDMVWSSSFALPVGK